MIKMIQNYKEEVFLSKIDLEKINLINTQTFYNDQKGTIYITLFFLIVGVIKSCTFFAKAFFAKTFFD